MERGGGGKGRRGHVRSHSGNNYSFSAEGIGLKTEREEGPLAKKRRGSD